MVVRILKCSHEELVGTIQTVYQSVANGIMFVNEKYGVIFVPDGDYVELNEIVEPCPECSGEAIWFTEKTPEELGYKQRCPYCGNEMMLCDACYHADDNPNHICDWLDDGYYTEGTCFRMRGEKPNAV